MDIAKQDEWRTYQGETAHFFRKDASSSVCGMVFFYSGDRMSGEADEKCSRCLKISKQKDKVSAEPKANPVYMSVHQVSERYGVSAPTIWRWARRKENPLPRPVKLGEGVTRWRVSELEEWERNLQRDA